MNSQLLLDRYLEKQFPNLQLASPLFYNADIGIRFEIGNPAPFVTNEEYKEQVHHRATKLFKEMHRESDDLLIVLYLYLHRKYTQPKKINAFDHSLKNTKVIRSLSCKSLQLDEEDSEGWESYRFVLKCKCSDIKYTKFLFADYDIYFVNTSRHSIFHFYDSRGLDIVAHSKENLHELYIRYNHWILDYDRERIDKTFGL